MTVPTVAVVGVVDSVTLTTHYRVAVFDDFSFTHSRTGASSPIGSVRVLYPRLCPPSQNTTSKTVFDFLSSDVRVGISVALLIRIDSPQSVAGQIFAFILRLTVSFRTFHICT